MYRHTPAGAGVAGMDGGMKAEVGRTDLPDVVPGSWASLWSVSLDWIPPGYFGSACGCSSNICSSTADPLAQLDCKKWT